MIRKVCGAFGIVAVALLVTTCGLIPVSEEGTIILAFGPQGMLAARTIEPALSMNPASYNVYGYGPAGRTFEQIDVEPDGIVQASLIPGEWEIVVHAFNDDDPPQKIGEGSAVVTIVAGTVVTLSIDVFPIEGPGQLLLTVSWPAGVLLDPKLTGTLTPQGGTPDPLPFAHTTDGLSASYASPALTEPGALPNGYYTLALSLVTENPDGSGPVHAWGTVEAVRIVAGEISSENYELVEDVNHGGIIINPELNNPIAVTISGVADPLLAGADMTVTAEPGGQDGYAWYLDGTPLLDGDGDPMTGATIIFGSDVALGYHSLSVVVTSGEVLSSASESFQVVRELGGSSLWGELVWGFDVWG